MYTHSILLLLAWPATILISWWLAKYAIKVFEKKQAVSEEKAGQIS